MFILYIVYWYIYIYMIFFQLYTYIIYYLYLFYISFMYIICIDYICLFFFVSIWTVPFMWHTMHMLKVLLLWWGFFGLALMCPWSRSIDDMPCFQLRPWCDSSGISLCFTQWHMFNIGHKPCVQENMISMGVLAFVVIVFFGGVFVGMYIYTCVFGLLVYIFIYTRHLYMCVINCKNTVSNFLRIRGPALGVLISSDASPSEWRLVTLPV